MKKPLPMLARRVLRKVLPFRFYARHFGRHEEGSLALWRKLAAEVPSDRCILDIGAYHGEFAIVAREVNAASPIYAFEPNPTSFAVLRERVVAGATWLNLAVSDSAGTIGFSCDSTRSAIAAGNVDFQVQAISIDQWCAANGVAPALIKIDVETHEAAVLRGAQKTLEDYQPNILCEVLSDAAGAAVARELPASYRFYHINENRVASGLTRHSTIYRDDWRYKNWLFSCREL